MMSKQLKLFSGEGVEPSPAQVELAQTCTDLGRVLGPLGTCAWARTLTSWPARV